MPESFYQKLEGWQSLFDLDTGSSGIISAQAATLLAYCYQSNNLDLFGC